MFVPTGIVKQQEIADRVAALARELAPDVVRIRHNLGEDWSGDPSIFFRVLLTDDAAEPARVAEVTERVRARLDEEFPIAEVGLQTYINFRSTSEQAELKDESWA